ncbi:acylneuraminate cytidylyltransferase [bacterium K02(2017)]|nr:acylneuraminate cytidylyltransferase [bacterium K02(2017)]
MNTIIIVQARMTSTRLPGKVLKPILGKPLLEFEIERLKQVSLANQIVIATTVNDADDQVITLCNKMGVSFFRGSEDDVLSRYYLAAKKFKADVVVRVTADCPLIDFQVIDQVIKKFISKPNEYDYGCNILERSFPRGLDVEVFSFSLLKNMFEVAKLPAEREHVTTYIHQNINKYKVFNVKCEFGDMSSNRWTVDTEEDFKLIETILKNIYPQNKQFVLKDVLSLIEKNPEWNLINAHVEQKKL